MLSFGKRTDEHVTELLSAYMDNQLNARERALADAHLRACPACAADLRSLQATVKAVQALPVVAAPRSFALQPSLQPARATSLSLLFLRLATAATTAALVVSMGAQVLLRSPQLALSPAPTAIVAAADTSSPENAPVAKGAAREAAPINTPAPAAIAAAPIAPPSPPAGAGAVILPTERSVMATPTAAAVTLAVPPPAAPTAPPAPAVAAAPVATLSAALPTATPAPSVTLTPLPAVAQAIEPGPTPPGPAAMTNATPAPQAAAPIVGPLQIALAALLVVLVGVLLVAGRRRT